MSPAEVCWRVTSRLRDAADRVLIPVRRRSVGHRRLAGLNGRAAAASVAGSHLDALECSANCGYEDTWRRRLIEQADHICRNRLNLFDLEAHDLGPVVDWNYEYKANKKSSMGFSSAIDYRDYEVTGDCKFVWELSRHPHLVILGRAYRLTGERRYAEKVAEHLDSWIEQCPYGTGMNWRSPLELAIRLINWVWALELIRPAGLIDEGRERRLMPAVHHHLHEISRKYSRFSSANNHLIGEAAGVFIGSSYFAQFRQSARWREASRRILAEEILNQTYSDGGTREQAMGYHLFVLEFLALCGLVARNTGQEFPAAYWDRLERMFEFVAGFVEGGGTVPMFGDCDDGYVLDLGGRENPAAAWLPVGAVLFGRADFKALSGGFSESAFWLLGSGGHESYTGIEGPSGEDWLRSRAFPESGYYLLQSGRHMSSDAISVSFDCGDLGFGPIAAHGHADALSFTLRAFGRDVFVDPGTYDYFSYGSWRDYFRSTRAHNTVVVDGCDQSEMLGPFLWGGRARSRCLRWEPTPGGGTVTGEHDGYGRVTPPVIHTRTITLDSELGEVRVVDQLAGAGRHTADFCLHLAEDCSLQPLSETHYEVNCGKEGIVVELDGRLAVHALCGAEDPIGGWVSRGYHRKQPATTLIGHCEWRDGIELVTRIRVRRATPARVLSEVGSVQMGRP